MARKAISVLTLLAVVAGVVGICLAGQGDKCEVLAKSGEARVGELAPFFAGWTPGNQVFNVKKAFADDPSLKAVALVFWQTTCAPCILGMCALNEAKPKLDAAHVRVALVNFQEPPEKVRSFLSTRPPKHLVVLDAYGQSEKTFHDPQNGSVALPRTVVVGRDLKVKLIIGAEGPDYVDLLTESGK